MSTPESKKSSAPWIIGMVLLGAAAVGAVMRLRSSQPVDRVAAATSTSKGPRCVSISPDQFTVDPGGRQELMARFSGGSGHRHFSWSVSGGTLLTSTAEGAGTTLSGNFYADDFDDGVLDLALWRQETAKDASLVEKQGVLLALLGNGDEDRAARLETQPLLEGDFAAQVTVRDVSAKGNRGAASLTFLTVDGYATHVQAMGGTGYAALEANTRNADGSFRTSATAYYGGGPVTLRIVRVGSALSCSFDRGSGQLPFGSFTDVSNAPGRLRLETWSLDEHPAVESEIDNFGAGQNTIVVWQAPREAAAGASYTISIDGCEAKATIGKP